VTSTLPRRAKGQPHRDYIADLKAAGVRYPHEAKRSARRRPSRDVSRAMAGPNLRKPSNGFFASLVNARPPMPVRAASARSGQARINTKRSERAAFWRTVKIRVSVEAEPHVRESLHLLGEGARIQGRAPLINDYAVDLDVHIPGAPSDAVCAEPVFLSTWDGEQYTPRVDYVLYYDADGHAINAIEPVGVAS
jgi:hypothetical protein